MTREEELHDAKYQYELGLSRRPAYREAFASGARWADSHPAESTIAQVLKAFFDAELDEDAEGVNKDSDFSHIASEIKKYMEDEKERNH